VVDFIKMREFYKKGIQHLVTVRCMSHCLQWLCVVGSNRLCIIAHRQVYSGPSKYSVCDVNVVMFQDWLPNNNSAILAVDFKSPIELAQYIHALNNDITNYKSFLKHKLGADEKITNKRLIDALEARKWGIDNDIEKGNFIEHFECFVCEQEHKKLKGERIQISNISKAHYNCPVPVCPLTGVENQENWWVDQWYMGKCEARILRHYVEIGKTDYNYQEFYNELRYMLLKKKC